jgi:hypothetical protein
VTLAKHALRSPARQHNDAADVALGISRAALTGNRRKSTEEFGFLANL